MYEYKCKVVKVVDGDTVDVDIDLGFGVWLRKQRVRLVGIDTPESRTKDLEEKKYGVQNCSTNFLSRRKTFWRLRASGENICMSINVKWSRLLMGIQLT